MKNRILGLGLNLGELDFRNIDVAEFDSGVALIDYDIIIIDMNSIARQYLLELDYYENIQEFQGLKQVSENDSFRLVNDIKRRHKQISECLGYGKTIMVIPPDENQYSVHTGKREHSGTGRNRATTRIVESIKLTDIIPFKIKLDLKNFGEQIRIVKNTLFAPIFEKSVFSYSYNSFLEFEKLDNVLPLAYALATEKIVAVNIKISKGNLMVGPSLVDSDNYESLSTEKYRKVVNKFLNSLDDLHENLKANINDFHLPKWTEKYGILDEFKIRNVINSIDNQIEELQKARLKKLDELKEFEKYKLLLTATGEQLEKIVFKLLLDLGFEPKETEINRADGVFTFGNQDIVTEVKGVGKSATEKHVAQLEKWNSEFLETNGREAKGLLIINTFREKDISDRAIADDFPNQILPYAQKRDQCLLTTTQLLCLYIESIKNPDNKNLLITELLNTVGVYDKFRDYESYLEIL
ncbi:MAG: hypothetical protein FWG67_00180 [Defluviitaleaceae bacterium]|nr:hypothetical protein [Defluviitaleaceae bacterium]